MELREDGELIGGPWPCYGKADNAKAAAQENPSRDPVLPYGDHPLGRYRVTGFLPGAHGQAKRFGPGCFILEPIEGDAARAKENGRTGLLIHGGSLDSAGNLRATFGCLRIPDEIVRHLARVQEISRIKLYRCEEEP